MTVDRALWLAFLVVGIVLGLVLIHLNTGWF